MKKILYSLLSFFVVLIVAIVFAANSSWVIKKAADKFAPEYKISYDDITGNLFTGVKISGLKFDGKIITKNINFSWNPSKILYKRVAINEISVDDLDVDVVKALIASFPTSDDNSSSGPLPVVILVDKVHVGVNPFEEQGILISETILDVKDVVYASDALDIEHLALQVDTNVAKVVLEASLDNGKLQIDKLLAEDIDSVFLEKKFLANDENSTKEKKTETKQSVKNEKQEPLNALIPKEVELKYFLTSIKPRSYKTVNIDTLKISAKDLKADIPKILSNSANSLNIGNFDLLFESNIGDVDFVGSLGKESVIFDQINLKHIDIFAIQTLVATDNNSSETNSSMPVADNNAAKETKEKNNLIPHYLVIKHLHTDLRETIYHPVHVVDKIHTDLRPDEYDAIKLSSMILNVKDFQFNIEKLIAEKGNIDLNGTSSFIDFTHSGKIKENNIFGDIVLIPKEELFKFYNLPIRAEAIDDITIDYEASPEKVVANLNTKAKQILITQKSDLNTTDSNTSENNVSKEFNVDIDSLKSHVVYAIKDNDLSADTQIMLTTPYAKDISITNLFKMNENVTYHGELNLKEITGLDRNLTTPLENLKIVYKGSTKSVKTDISSNGLKGSFVSSDFKKGKFHIETTEAIHVDKMLTLPAELNGTKVNVVIDVPLDFEKITPLNAKAKITSNITNIDADITYGETLHAKVTSNIPEDSLLKNFDKNVKWNAISPLVINADLGKKDATLKLKSKELSSDIKYMLDNGKVEGTIRLAGLVTDIKGIADENITINAKVDSMESLMTSVKSFYTLEDLPPVEGALYLSVDIMKLKQANLTLSSPQIIYHSDRQTEHIVDDVKLVVSADKSKVQLKSYNVVYQEMKIYSTKPSVINIKEEVIEIAPLWLNDELQVVGTYDLKAKKGDISADAKKLHLAHKMIELDSGINIKTALNGEKTSVKGKVVLLGGKIHYDLGTKTYPSDSDIIIVQDMKKEEASPFMDNLSMLIDVTTKKPLIYKQGPIDIAATVDLDIHKGEYSDPMVLGEVNILKGGSYTFEGKRFVLDRSNIYFTGDLNKPLLDISVKYKSLNHLITIGISGTPATPIIIFSSIPSLSREQILSVILFDSEAGAGTNSGDDMMKMMGGAMAKSALSDMGIKLDHLAIGSDGSMEVGKKLTDKIMFIYINDEIPQMRVKYQHTSRLESVISADEESEAYDIVYKRDFSEDDIIIFGK